MSDPHLDELWQRVLETWSEDAAHGAFLEHARVTKQLGEAAARYREQVKNAAGSDDATRAETAQKRLGAIAILAMADLEAARTPRDWAMFQSGVRWVAALIMFAFVVYLLVKFVAR